MRNDDLVIAELIDELGSALVELDVNLKSRGQEDNTAILASVSPMLFHVLALMKVGGV